MENPPTLVLIDKPLGLTSFGVVARVRRILGVKKVGHAGTLDPLASGLMLVGVGQGTKALTGLVKLDKEYVAEVLIGRSTTTSDREGGVVAERPVTEPIPKSSITAALANMQGAITLPVSAYSAIKVDGVPMYKRARAAARVGTVAEPVRARRMYVYETELQNSQVLTLDTVALQLLTIRFRVGSGTYIRSLAEELGRRLGYPASLYNLRRTQVGEYRIEDAVTLETLATEYGTKLF